MTLILRIENYDVLEDGGPSSITLNQKGCSVGRGRGMDWVLPDPAKHISSHHFDITFSSGSYQLTDVSTNGTFLQGQRYRLDGPQTLKSGDKFTVGHYVVGITLPVQQQTGHNVAPPDRPMIQAPPGGAQTWTPGAGAPSSDDSDPWDFGAPSAPAAAPVPPVSPAPAPAPAAPKSSFSPPPTLAPGGATPPGHMPLSQPPGSMPAPSTPISAPPSGRPASPPASLQSAPPASVPMPAPGAIAPTPVPPGPAPAPIPALAPQTPTPAAPAGSGDLLRAFCEGAGLKPEAYAGVNEVELAKNLGKSVRIATEEIMKMLQDRAAVKQFTKGGERTMRSATGNNPMKFLTETNQVVETLFLKPRDGFMTGNDGFENALADIRMHQTAVFAALQPALAKLLGGISPDEIEEESGGGLLGGSSRAKAWDTYVERWDAKANKGDNGMLDAFLEAFAKAYAEAASKSGV